jgi:recombinational DNA repair ATPase RecF
MLLVACTLSVIIVLCLLSMLALWEASMNRRRLFMDALLTQVAGQRRETQRQLQWVAQERTHLQEEREVR